MFFEDKLTPKQHEIKAQSEVAGLITSIFNCHIKVYINTDDEKLRSVMPKSLKTIDDITNTAIKKTKVVKSILFNSVENSRTSRASFDLYNSILKQLWSSPDEDSVRTFKNFCMRTTF